MFLRDHGLWYNEHVEEGKMYICDSMVAMVIRDPLVRVPQQHSIVNVYICLSFYLRHYTLKVVKASYKSKNYQIRNFVFNLLVYGNLSW